MKRLELGRGVFTASAVLFSAVAGAATTVTTNDANDVTYNVPTGETYVENGSWDATIAKVTKTGGGTLELKVASSDFKNKAVVIESGYVKTKCNSALGSSNTITVRNGAALVGDFYTGAQTTRGYPYCTIEIEGDGPDHTGAFKHLNTSNNDYLVYKLKLIGPATIGGAGRFGVGAEAWAGEGGGVVDLNGHTLTNKATTFMFFHSRFANPGHFVQLGGVTQQANDVAFNGSAENTLTIADGKTWKFWGSVTTNTSWTVKGEGATTFEVGSGSGLWQGPVESKKGITVKFPSSDNASTMTFNGDMSTESGALSVNVASYANKFLNLYCGNHSFAGGINLAGPCDMTVTGGVKHVLAGTVQVQYGAHAVFQDAGLVTQGLSTAVSTAPLSRRPSRIEVLGKTTFLQSEPTTTFPTLRAGDYPSGWGVTDLSNAWGVVRIADGARVKASVRAGQYGRGAVYLVDSTLDWTSGPSNDGVIGGLSTSYGAVLAEDSTFNLQRYLNMAQGAQSTAFLVLKGGSACETTSGQSFTVSRGGYGHVYVSDGCAFDLSTAELRVGSQSYSTSTGGMGVITVEGPGSGIACKTAYLLWRTNFTSQVNLNNGGSFAVWNCSSKTTDTPPGSVSRLSFDGGVWRPLHNQSTGMFLSGGAAERATVYAGGAIVDIVNSINYDWQKCGFRKPTGLVLKSVTLPTDETFLAEAAKAIGPLQLVVEGAGSGACAFVAFDARNEQLLEPVVVSPGYDYDASSTVKVLSMDGSQSWPCAAEFGAPEKDGGLMTVGPGRLMIGVACDYEGPTVVSNGTLRAYCDKAIPETTTLRLAGGTFECHTNKVTVANLEGYGAVAVYNPTPGTFTVTGKIKVSARDLKAGRTLSLLESGGGVYSNRAPVFADGSTLEVTDLEALDHSSFDQYTILKSGAKMTTLPQIVNVDRSLWRIKLSSDGKSLTMTARHGTMLIVR